jgi:F-type H+-transporting ATPase subunit gamma
MANTKEIRTKIRSIQSTKKITRAMEMVAASKMRKVQKRMQSSRPYSSKIKLVVQHLVKGKLEFKHKYLLERKVNNVGFIVVSTDRGLCGGLNANLFKSALSSIRSFQEKSVNVHLCVIGKKAQSFFSSIKGNVVASVTNIGDTPSTKDLIGAVKVMLDKYDKNLLDKIYVVYNEFVNTMVQKPIIEQLLPISYMSSIKDAENHNPTKYWDYLYEPDAKELLNRLLNRYLESLVYQAVVENIACEQAARMVAMKSATDNASDFIDSLKLQYNKARQAAITQELSEIVAGAAAV